LNDFNKEGNSSENLRRNSGSASDIAGRKITKILKHSNIFTTLQYKTLSEKKVAQGY
jgi:hypothetical protein